MARLAKPPKLRHRCGRCKTPLTGYEIYYQREPTATYPEDRYIAAMGVPVGSIPTTWVLVKIIITHQPCGCEFWKAPPR